MSFLLGSAIRAIDKVGIHFITHHKDHHVTPDSISHEDREEALKHVSNALESRSAVKDEHLKQFAQVHVHSKPEKDSNDPHAHYSCVGVNHEGEPVKKFHVFKDKSKQTQAL